MRTKHDYIKTSSINYFRFGPAGWTAAVYAARANLKPVVITGFTPGGQLSLTTDVDNWPGGKEGLQGPELMENMKQHAERFNTEVIFDEITSADLETATLYPER